MAKTPTKDAWKMKKWYNIFAPEIFNSVKIGTTPATEEAHVMGRIIEINLADLAGDYGDPKKQRQTLYFKVDAIKGSDVQTKLIKVEAVRDFERSLVRRGNSKIEAVVTAKTKDGNTIRAKVLGLSNRKPQATKEKLIRRIFIDLLTASAQQEDYQKFMQDVIYGSVAAQMYKNANKIYPMRHVTISKCRIVA